MHFVAPSVLRWLIELSGPRVEAGNARRYRELGLDPSVLARATEVIAESVADRPQTRRELGERLEQGGISAAGQRIAYMVMHAELTAIVCSGPMRGKQHTYAAIDERVPGAKGVQRNVALAQLTRRYFTTRGPATVDDPALGRVDGSPTSSCSRAGCWATGAPPTPPPGPESRPASKSGSAALSRTRSPRRWSAIAGSRDLQAKA